MMSGAKSTGACRPRADRVVIALFRRLNMANSWSVLATGARKCAARTGPNKAMIVFSWMASSSAWPGRLSGAEPTDTET